VTGDWRYPGGGVSYSTSGYFGGDREALWRDDLLERPVRSLAHTNLAANLLDLDDPPVKALVVYGANPMSSNPGSAGVRKGLLREDLFTVVLEQFPTDTADYADIVLPATMQTEHLDLHDGYGHMYLLLNQPAVEPAGEALSTTETFRRLAKRMGLTEPSLYDSDETQIRTLLGSGHPSLDGITYERLQREGWVRLNYATPFVPFADGFPTPSGKLEFVSATAAADGLDPLVGYTPPAEAATERGDLALISPASHWFLNSTFGNHPGLRERSGGPRIELHPDDAARRGLATGDEARVFNARGEFVAAVEVSDRVRPGVVASTKGHWLKHVRGGQNANATVAERDADMGRGAVFHDNRVQVESIRSSASSARLSGTSIPHRSAARTTAPLSASYSSGLPDSRS
jgi:anaerobic selenocysteine-containing dehydrogenase